MDVLKGVLAQFGVEVDTSALENADKTISGFMGQLRQLGGLLAGGALIGQLNAFVSATTETFDRLADDAQRLQVSTDSLQEWRYAAKLSGVEAGELDSAIGALTRSLQGVAEGADKPAALLRKLGISAKDSQGNLRSFEALLPEIADAIASLPSDTERAGTTMRLFGRAGLALLPFLKQGRAGIAGLKKEFAEIGGGVSADAIQAMADYRDQVDRAEAAFEALKAQVVLSLLPAWNLVMGAAQRISKFFSDLSRNTHMVDIALAGLGVALGVFAVKAVIALAPVLAPIVAIAAGVTVLVAAVDDLWTTFEGGESVIQQTLDGLFGVGTTAELVDGLVMVWDDLTTSILEAGQALKEYLGFGKAEPVEDRQTKRARERTQREDAAVLAGDVQAFSRSRQAAGRISQEDVQKEFLARRRKALEEGRATATETDVASGLAPSAGPARAVLPGANGARAPLPAGSKERAGIKVDAPTQVNINLPAGADKRLQEEMRKAAQIVFTEQMRGARAALVGSGG